MTSLEIFEFKETLRNFALNSNIPTIVVDMIVNELHEELQNKLKNELISQVEERERHG